MKVKTQRRGAENAEKTENVILKMSANVATDVLPTCTYQFTISFALSLFFLCALCVNAPDAGLWPAFQAFSK
jgi:hypothetical protein